METSFPLSRRRGLPNNRPRAYNRGYGIVMVMEWFWYGYGYDMVLDRDDFGIACEAV
jgi:hypothetical protein